MKKLTQLVGVFATGLISVTGVSVSGCSSTPDPVTNTAAGTASTAGTGGAAAGGATGTGGSTLLMPPSSYTALTGADALPGAAAPAAWAAKGCNVCHGANGEGVPSIGTEVRHAPIAYATYIVRHGRAPFIMAEFPETPMAMKVDVSAADLTSILTWLGSLPKPTTGQGLYKDFCGNCHGPNMATGGAVAISIIGKTRVEIAQKVRTGEGTDPGMRNGFMPPEDMAALSDVELGLIEDYLMAK